jgi:hypothetical protein
MLSRRMPSGDYLVEWSRRDYLAERMRRSFKRLRAQTMPRSFKRLRAQTMPAPILVCRA